MKSVVFFNWSDEDFTWTWDKKPWDFAAGSKVYIQDYLANHFAKHLVDRELLKHGKNTDYEKVGDNWSRTVLLKKTIISAEGQDIPSKERQEMELLNQKSTQLSPEENLVKAIKATDLNSDFKAQPFCDSCDSKGVRHKKECPKSKVNAAKSAEETHDEFKKLNETPAAK
jgi:hypothetical protein